MNDLKVITQKVSLKTYQDCLDIAKAYSDANKICQFGIGDAIIQASKYTDGQYISREVYNDFEQVTGLSRKTLREYAYTANKCQSSMRMDDLSFYHHQIALEADNAEREYFLKEASQNKWSCSELKSKIKEHNKPFEEVEVINNDVEKSKVPAINPKHWDIEYDIKCKGVSALVHKIFKQSMDDDDVINEILKEIRRLKRR